MNTVINKGLAILMPEVATMRREIERYLSKLLVKNGYQPLYSPHIGDIELFKTSGHYPYYKDDMFAPIEEIPDTALPVGDLDQYILKPMNCPFHVEAYKAIPRSYKALPLRFYEFGTVYRNEASGALNGLLRLRGFTQDDGHIFCKLSQVGDEVKKCIELVQTVMKQFEMKVDYVVSCRSREEKDQAKYIGSLGVWTAAEQMLCEALPYYDAEDIVFGGAAFYGPKIDFMVTDKLGRTWQLGTIQLDFNLPERFDLAYKGADNQNHRPVMIHRALLGSLERFIAILLEQYQGKIPYWLALEQCRIIPVHSSNLEYAKKVCQLAIDDDVRCVVDEEEAPLRAKIKKAKEDKVPVVIVVGNKEQEKQVVTLNGVDCQINDFIGNHIWESTIDVNNINWTA